MGHDNNVPATSPLNISEILDMILSHLDDRSLANCVRVRKDWAEIALSILWRTVDDLPRLLSLLCPFAKPAKSTKNHSAPIYHYKFKRALTPHDWERFQRYSARVRCIAYNQRSPKSWNNLLDSSVFAELATCPTSSIFSNLRSLTWNSDCKERQVHSLVFLSPRLEYLDIRIPSLDRPCTYYLHQVAAGAPNLTHLTIRLSASVLIVESAIISLLRSLNHLQSVSMPLYGLTSNIVDTLSRKEHLQEIAVCSPADVGNGFREDLSEFLPVLHPGAFPALQRMSFTAHVSDATRFVNSLRFPSGLTHLQIQVLSTVEPDALRQLFLAISGNCRSLTSLHVDFMICPGAPLPILTPPLRDRPNIVVFRPLFACRRISSFEFRWDYALNLTDADVDEFALHWPLLESLFLNPEPVIEYDPPRLTLGALIPFARHCHHLRELGLCINATLPPSDPCPILRPFKALERLCVGASALTSVEPVALFLSQLCAPEPTCRVVTGVRWPDAYGVALDRAGILDERRARMCDYWVRWNEVVKVLPVVIYARADERRRRKELEGQVDVLVRARREEVEEVARLREEVRLLRGHCAPDTLPLGVGA